MIPCLEMLPFIQCHQTRGRAASGGSRNWLSSVADDVASDGDCAGTGAVKAAPATTSTVSSNQLLVRCLHRRDLELKQDYQLPCFFLWRHLVEQELRTSPDLLRMQQSYKPCSILYVTV